MSAYIASLKAEAEQERVRQVAQAETDRAAQVDAARDRLTPLDDRLVRLLATIPIEVQRDGLSLPSLQGMLKGRCRGSAHPGQVGSALRRLGWTRRRSWHGSATAYSARWFPSAGS